MGAGALKYTITTRIVISFATDETLVVKDRAGNVLKEILTCIYLESVTHAKGGCKHGVKYRVKVAWQKSKRLNGCIV